MWLFDPLLHCSLSRRRVALLCIPYRLRSAFVLEYSLSTKLHHPWMPLTLCFFATGTRYRREVEREGWFVPVAPWSWLNDQQPIEIVIWVTASIST